MGDPAAQVRAIADAYLEARLATFPELATVFGILGARHDRLGDRSAEAERAWQAKEDGWLAALRAISLRGTPEWVTHGLLHEELEARTGLRVCRNRLWTVHPLTGWQARYAALAQQQPVGSVERQAQARMRWRALPAPIDAEIANLREGVAAGYTAPKVNVRRVIEGFDRLLAAPPVQSPFFSPAARDSSPGFRVAFERLVTNGITPAIRYLATKPGARLDMDRLTFHEAVPGHHFHFAIARERQGVHPVTRYLSNSAFTEGWGSYAERVAGETGLYDSDATRLNDLEGMVYGFATIVMETAMHVKGWSRQQAIDYELAHTTRTAEQAALDVDRRIGWPGQGLSYIVGYLELRRLRELAERRLGARFDIRAFHDRVLEDGSVTLPMLREKLEASITAVEADERRGAY